MCTHSSGQVSRGVAHMPTGLDTSTGYDDDGCSSGAPGLTSPTWPTIMTTLLGWVRFQAETWVHFQAKSTRPRLLRRRWLSGWPAGRQHLVPPPAQPGVRDRSRGMAIAADPNQAPRW